MRDKKEGLRNNYNVLGSNKFKFSKSSGLGASGKDGTKTKATSFKEVKEF